MSNLSEISPTNRDDFSPSWISSKFADVVVDGKKRRKCLGGSCEKLYSFRTSHTHLRHHWHVDHGDFRRKQTRFDLHDDYPTHCIISMIIEEQLPYTLVSSRSFKKVIHALDPNAVVISRAQLSDVIIRKSDCLRSLLKNTLKHATSVALTLDLWTASNSRRSFAAITAHYISDEMDLCGFYIEFKRLPYPHDSFKLEELITETIRTYDIGKKIVAITSDNDAAIISALRQVNRTFNFEDNFGFKAFHLRCIGHVVHLAAKAALESENDTVLPVKSVIMQIVNSTKRSEEFREIQQRMIDDRELVSVDKPLQLIFDTETRWNSVLLMLERAHLLKNAIDQAMIEMRNLRDLNLGIEIPWSRVNELIEFLQPCLEITTTCSADKTVSLSTVASYAPILAEHVESYLDDPTFGNAATALNEKLLKYLGHLCTDLTIVATILDPRIKLNFLKNRPQITPEISIDENDVIDIECASISEQEWILMLESFLERIGPSEAHESSQQIEPSLRPRRSIFRRIFQNLVPASQNDEVARYLAAPRVAEKSGILSFWRDHRKEYPRLAKLAKIIFCAQATSTASERAFSIAAEIDTAKRNRLSDESFRANMLLRSFIKQQ